MDILPQLLVNAMIAGSIYALASAGLSLTYGLLKILNFAHGHLMMVGAYAFFFVHVQHGFGLVTSALLTVLMIILVSVITLVVFVLPFTKFSFFLVFVTTLALSTMLESLVSIFFGVNVKTLAAGMRISSMEIYGVYITPIQILIIASAVILLSLLAFVIHSTSIGRKIRAISEYPQGAQSLGISKTKITVGVFTAGVLLAAYAGILVGYETNMQPTMGHAYTIKAFAAMVLGGLGNIWGTIAGSYILGLVENLSVGLDFGPYSIPAGYKDAFAFFIILLVLLFKPKGLFNTRSRES